MFSKVKCPNCGAKNSKERMTCATCGALLSSVQVERQAEKETEIAAREEAKREAERQPTEVPTEGKPNLVPSMKELYPTLNTLDEDAELCAELCADLRAIGVDARMAERGRPEENVASAGDLGVIGSLLGVPGGEKSIGLIEIQGSPIRWVNLKEERHGAEGRPSLFTTIAHYLVPDPKMCWEGYLELKSVRVKSMPIVGRVLDLRWESNVEGNLVRQLNQDVLLKQTLIGLKEDIKILSDPKYRGWIIVKKSTRAPSRELWNCYELVAHHLISDTFRPGTAE